MAVLIHGPKRVRRTHHSAQGSPVLRQARKGSPATHKEKTGQRAAVNPTSTISGNTVTPINTSPRYQRPRQNSVESASKLHMRSRGGQIPSGYPPSRVPDNQRCHGTGLLEANREHSVMSSPTVENRWTRDRVRAVLRLPAPHTRTTRKRLPSRTGSSSKLAWMRRVRPTRPRG